MSCSSYGQVIVGVKVSKESLESALEKIRQSKSVKVKGCNHKYSDKVKFCPECGSPKETTKEAPVIEVDSWIEELGLEFECSTDRIDYFFTTDRKWIGSTGDINCGATYESIPFPTSGDLREIVDTLIAKLSPYGLWDANDFRIWVVGYCSY